MQSWKLRNVRQKGQRIFEFISMRFKMFKLSISGHVEFRYNLGSGTVILRSKSKIPQGKRTIVVAKRYLREGVLSVSQQQDITGKAEGDLKSLDLRENMFVGKVQSDFDRIHDNVGTRMGFTGCLFLLRIGRVKVNLTYPGSTDIVKAINIVDCDDLPCCNANSA